MKVTQDINILHKKSYDVDLSNKQEVERLSKMLRSTFSQYSGKMQGVSAIQLKEQKRIFLVRWKKGEEPIVMINPKVHFKFGVLASNEGCLSEGTSRWYVLRPLIAFASYYDENSVKHNCVLPYKKSRIFMHEYDHLDGILLRDKGLLI